MHHAVGNDASEEILYSNAETKMERIICKGFIMYLQELKNGKQWKLFTKIFITVFSNEINNKDFISYVAKKLMMYPSRLLERLRLWSVGYFD